MVASSSASSSTILKDIIGNDLGDGNEVTQAVIKTTLETIDNVCNRLKGNLDNAEDENPPEGIGKDVCD